MRSFIYLPVLLTASALYACSAGTASDLDLGAPRPSIDGRPSVDGSASSSGETPSSPSTSDDGGGPIVTPGPVTADAGPPPPRGGLRKIFVTSATFSGDLIGEAVARKLLPSRPTTTAAETAAAMLKSADLLCSLVADSAGLGRGWKAYLSTPAFEVVPAQRAVDRVTGNGPWVLTDGTTAFATKSAFLVGPAIPINVTEAGAKIPAGDNGGNNGVWTGTDGNGNAIEFARSCAFYSTNRDKRSSPYRGTIGNSELVGTRWQSYATDFDCSDQRRLYCLEEQ